MRSPESGREKKSRWVGEERGSSSWSLLPLPLPLRVRERFEIFAVGWRAGTPSTPSGEVRFYIVKLINHESQSFIIGSTRAGGTPLIRRLRGDRSFIIGLGFWWVLTAGSYCRQVAGPETKLGIYRAVYNMKNVIHEICMDRTLKDRGADATTKPSQMTWHHMVAESRCSLPSLGTCRLLPITSGFFLITITLVLTRQREG